MKTKLNDYQRIESVKNFLKIGSWRQFASIIGAKNGQIFTNLKYEKNKISANLASRVCALDDRIDYSWLLTGEGEMLRAGASNIVTAHGDNKGATIAGGNVTTAAGDSDRLLAIIESQQATIASQQQSSSELVAMLKKLAEKIVVSMPTVVAVVALASSLALTGCERECVWKEVEVPMWEQNWGDDEPRRVMVRAKEKYCGGVAVEREWLD